MPDTIENVETMEQVEVQDTTANGLVSTFIAGAIIGAVLYTAGNKLMKLAQDGLKKHKAKREREKMTVVEGGKNQDNSESDTDVKDETK